jgi:hypothetical protein
MYASSLVESPLAGLTREPEGHAADIGAYGDKELTVEKNRDKRTETNILIFNTKRPVFQRSKNMIMITIIY